MTARIGQVLDDYDRPVPGAKIYVYKTDGTEADLTSDGTTAISQPLSTDEFGSYAYQAPDAVYREDIWYAGKLRMRAVVGAARGDPGGDGAIAGLFTELDTVSIPEGVDLIATSGYSALDQGSGVYVNDEAFDVDTYPRAGFTSANERTFRLSDEQSITPRQFGAVGDGLTDDGPAFAAAIAYLKTRATSGYGYGSLGAPTLFIPRGIYFLNTTTLDIDFGLIIEGESVGLVGPGSTVLSWLAGTTGIRTQKNNTTGATGTKTSVANSGIATIRNLLLHGSYAGGAESEAHGIHLREQALIENVGIYNFAGDGIYCVGSAGAGSPGEGAPNEADLFRVFVQACRNGFYIDGADANALTLFGCKATGNRAWGFWDSSFLGNFYYGCRAASNGWDGAATSIPTAATFGGNRYFVKPGQAVGASTNAPSGTTADNTWWGYMGAGGTFNGIVAWVSGTTFREGGGFKTDDANQSGGFFGCYVEGDQNPSQVMAPNVISGGFLAPTNRGNAATIKSDTGGSFQFGPTMGGNAGQTFLETSNSFHTLVARLWANGVPSTIGSIDFVNASGTIYDVNNAAWQHLFRVNGTLIAALAAAGLNLSAGKVLSVGGTQVVGARQTGTPADATDLATALTLLNALKAKLVTHGLIS